MLAYEYRTCQDKVEGNLEVIGGARVRARMEKGNQESERKEPAIGARVKSIKTKS
jgi:hypothetical protein